MTASSLHSAELSRLPEAVRDVANWLQGQRIQGARLLVGVSGGADSVALLLALEQCRSPLGLEVIVAHLDHGLRSDSSADAKWVTALGEQLDLPVALGRVDVARQASDARQGIEETARQVRYDFFRRAADERSCPYVAVAHTADDQAETILHHIVRGTGLSGLQGMPALRPLSPDVTLIRPLLETSRESVIDFLARMGQEYLVDDSNTDEQFTRNRVRHSLLPLLREQFNPQVDRALLRLSQQATDAQALVEACAQSELRAVILDSSPALVRLNADRLSDLSTHLLREVLRQLWLEQDWPRQRMGFDVWQRLAMLVQSPESAKSMSLPHDLHATCEGSTLVIMQTKRGSSSLI